MNPKDRSKKKQPQYPKPAQRAENTVSKWVWFAVVIVLVTTAAIYYNAINFGFLETWDDNLYIRDNSDIKALHWANIKLFFTTIYANNYQPVLMFFYALEYKIGAGKASIFHLSNIILHLSNTILVFVLIGKISPKSDLAALITAAFFAVHPMHVESVAWIAERKDVLYSFFFLLSLITYTTYIKLQKLKYLGYTSVFFMLSCFSKSAAVILPLIMLLFDYYQNRKYNWKMIAEKIPFFLISLIFGLVAVQSQKGAIQDRAPIMSVIEHISIVSFSFTSYLYKALIPVNLSAVYAYPVETGSNLPLVYYLSVLPALLVLFFAWHSRRWGKDIAFGFLFFIITIVLVLQFVPVGGATMADRYTYIPYIGLFFIMGKLFERFSLHADSKIIFNKYASAFLVAGFITFSTIVYARVQVWKNDDTLFSDVISKYPNCGIAYRMRGLYFQHYHSAAGINREEDLKKAASDFETSLKLIKVTRDNTGVCFNIGVIKDNLGDVPGAIQWYDKSIATDPSYCKAYLNRGSCYINYYAGKVYANDQIRKEIYLRKAIEDFEYSLKCQLNSEDKAKACFNSGIAKSQLNDFAGAVADFDKGILIDSIVGGANIYALRASAKYQLKDYEGSVEDFQKAIDLNPQDISSITNLEIVKSMLNYSSK
ncbi:MAG: tetratricopeptide repeat protein [Bacteroidota bacterium]